MIAMEMDIIAVDEWDFENYQESLELWIEQMEIYFDE